MKVKTIKTVDFEDDDVQGGVEVGIDSDELFYVVYKSNEIILTKEQWRFVISVLEDVIDAEDKPLPNPTKKVKA